MVANFVRYQMGRDKKRQAWAKRGRSGKALGDLLVAAIEEGDGAIKTAVASVDELEGPAEQVARMQMLRHFLGFISRHLKYLEPRRAGNGREGGEA